MYFPPSPNALVLLLFPAVSLCFLGCSQGKDKLETDSRKPFSIFATCDTSGWIEPCGCANGQAGGLSRRATLMDELSGELESLRVSVGGAALGSKPYDQEKFNAIIDGEVLMGCTVHNLGVAEIAMELPVRSDITFLSTNASFVASHVKPWVRTQVAGADVLVLGVVSPALTEKINAQNIDERVEDPQHAILNAIAKQESPAEIVVVLGYLDSQELRELAENVPEVDVIIGGKVPQSIAPVQTGRTLLAAISNQGKFVARIELEPQHASSNSTPENYTAKADLHEVHSEFAENERQIANLKSFRERLAKFDFPASKTHFDSFIGGRNDHDTSFVGASKCKECHESDWEIWERSGHAHAWQTLSENNAYVDSDCQRCHTTGFGASGGFINRQKSPNRIDVGCESCHGPGSKHLADPEVSTPWLAADSCLMCHDHENSPEFEYESYWEQIAHGNKEPANAE